MDFGPLVRAASSVKGRDIEFSVGIGGRKIDCAQQLHVFDRRIGAAIRHWPAGCSGAQPAGQRVALYVDDRPYHDGDHERLVG